MHYVLISIASNFQPEKHLCEAHAALAEILSDAVYTKEIWTTPEGSKGQSSSNKEQESLYLNQLVSAKTSINADELNCQLKKIELKLGRTNEYRQQGIVTIDLDLLQHDMTRYHLRDWNRKYIRKLLELLDETSKAITENG